MREDLDVVFDDLFSSRLDPARRSRARSMARVEDGVAALDYGDEDHAFRVTVELVPRRRWAPEQPLRVGQVDGVDVDLAGVTVDNFVHVRLTAAPSPERDRLQRLYTDDWERWEATYRDTRLPPPDEPSRRLMQIVTRVADDLGTPYRFHVGETNRDSWDARQSFAPRPPAGVHELHLSLQAPGQPEASALVTL